MFGFFRRRAERLELIEVRSEAMELAIREVRASVDGIHDKMFAGNSSEESQERVRLTLRVEKLESGSYGQVKRIEAVESDVADLRKAQANTAPN